MNKRVKTTAATAGNTAVRRNSETTLEESKAEKPGRTRQGGWPSLRVCVDETVVTEEEAYEAIEEAFREMEREGLIYDTGERRWSNQTQRYEIVWKAKTSGLLWGGA